MKNFIPHIPKWCLYILGIVVSVKALHEPDTFWQLRTGQWILQNGQVPKQDVFSSSMQGKPWVNIKWGYEVIIAAIQKLTSIECIFIVQIIVTLALIVVVQKIIIKFTNSNQWAVLGVGIIAIAITSFRINGRPESISWVMAVAFIYILLQPLTLKNFAALFILQILWCNLHEAFGIGLVIAIIYCVANVATKFIDKILFDPKIFLLIPILMIATCINPYGIQLAIKPLEIFNQIQTNKYTTELCSVLDADYWQWQAKLFWVMVVLACIGVFYYRKSIVQITKQQQYFYVIIVLAFTVLAALAIRNLPFAVFVWLPIWALLLSTIVRNYIGTSKGFAYSMFVLFVIFYGSLVSNIFYKNTGNRDAYGLQMLNSSNPYGAANYLKSQNLHTSIFADYLVSSYLLQSLQPNFKTYIDLRDLDVFSDTFFNNYIQVVNNTDSFMQFLNKQNYNTVVLYNNSFPNLHARLYNDSIFACTFVDGVAAIYQRTDQFSKQDIFAAYQSESIHPVATVINTICNPFFNTSNYDDIPYDALAAQYYINVYRFDLAEKRIQSLLQTDGNNQIVARLQNQISTIKNSIKQ